MAETEYNKWVKELRQLNDRINAIKPWNDRAEQLQREYDQLLTREPYRRT